MTQPLSYVLCDVFTQDIFGGNQLAVIPNAQGLTRDLMQHIAREFNFSETVFIFPAQGEGDFLLRIFTPHAEMPFAGHPTLGAAFVLAMAGGLGSLNGDLTVTFSEPAGPVVVTIKSTTTGDLFFELRAPSPFYNRGEFPVHLVSKVLSLSPDNLSVHRHRPSSVSMGYPFLMVEVDTLDSLIACTLNHDAFTTLVREGAPPDLLCYTRETSGCDVRVRVFAPLDGIPEDPATGSAATALSALLTTLDPRTDCHNRYHIVQGVTLGRPSHLFARAKKQKGKVVQAFVGGHCVLVSRGELMVP